jgi:hypothetical protein
MGKSARLKQAIPEGFSSTGVLQKSSANAQKSNAKLYLRKAEKR